ncbi:hypothetical protein Pint_27999 [Pistacia integerrima]|uniref:Uncharacterized protein n=1 Tax=Pistacia integerrima TaxID=434235 RepID=A0ACC0YQV9_9ROSI|nr:hypothetical protein Pint_27999 [Pistacia integerrima]
MLMHVEVRLRIEYISCAAIWSNCKSDHSVTAKLIKLWSISKAKLGKNQSLAPFNLLHRRMEIIQYSLFLLLCSFPIFPFLRKKNAMVRCLQLMWVFSSHACSHFLIRSFSLSLLAFIQCQ